MHCSSGHELSTRAATAAERRVWALAALLLALSWSPLDAATVTGRVVRVIGGDTLVVVDHSQVQHKIRLAGIDAPERGQPFGRQSTEHLAQQVAGRFVVVEYDKRGRYGRLIGKVLLGGEDQNLAQVEAGLAWHYNRYQREQSVSDRSAYAEAEERARVSGRGLWGDRQPVPPWEWREKRRGDAALRPLPVPPGRTSRGI